MGAFRWTIERMAAAKQVLARHRTVEAAAAELDCKSQNLRTAFNYHGLSATAFLATDIKIAPAPEVVPPLVEETPAPGSKPTKAKKAKSQKNPYAGARELPPLFAPLTVVVFLPADVERLTPARVARAAGVAVDEVERWTRGESVRDSVRAAIRNAIDRAHLCQEKAA